MNAKNIRKMSFEEAVNELKSIVSKLQSSDVELDRLVQYYDVGTKLRQHAQNLLSNAKLKIKKIQSNQSDYGKIDSWREDMIKDYEQFIDASIDKVRQGKLVEHQEFLDVSKDKFAQLVEILKFEVGQ